MKKTALILFILLQTANLYTQQYLIRYDLATENLKYFEIRKKGDTISVPVINLIKSGKVNLRLQNLSGSFADSIAYEEKTEPAETIHNPWRGGNNNGVPGSPFLKNMTGFASLSTEELSGAGKNKMEIMSFDGGKTAIQKYREAYDQFIKAYNNWSKSALFAGECKTLLKDLIGLRFSIQYTSEALKETAQQKASRVFPEISSHTTVLQLYEMAGGADPYKDLQLLELAFENIKQISDKENLLREKQVDSSQQFANKLRLVAENFTQKETVKDVDLEQIASYYHKILEDNYTRNHSLQIGRNTSAVLLTLKPVTDPGDTLIQQILKIKETEAIKLSIPIYKKSPVRFRNTYGLSFVSYTENRWRYFVKTTNNINRIERETADYFQPVICSFLHFYAPRDRGFRWGGSFGAGVPVGSNLETKLNIFLGLTSFLGKNDPVAITIGCAGTKLSKLSGFQLGEVVPFTELDAIKNFQNVYRVGYYLSVSFNPYGINAKN